MGKKQRIKELEARVDFLERIIKRVQYGAYYWDTMKQEDEDGGRKVRA